MWGEKIINLKVSLTFKAGESCFLITETLQLGLDVFLEAVL